MASTVLSARVLAPEEASWVALQDGVLAELGTGKAPKGSTDLSNAVIAPGLIDLQVNGVEDADFASAGPQDWDRAVGLLLSHGVTGFCPTLVSAPLDFYEEAITRVGGARARSGGAILGVHLEGPFLGGAPGAHPREVLRPASVEWLQRLIEEFGDLLRIVTLAPEADPDLTATKTLAQNGVLVSLGHSTCTYEEALDAAGAGARAVTHLFNGMAPMHHRSPGLAGAALDDDRLTPTLIADLIHVHPAALRLPIARKRGVGLVSDAIALNSRGGSRGVRVVDGAPRLPDGTLAGSVLWMDQAIRNLVGIGIPLRRAVEMATEVPADLLRLSDRGRIVPGARADLIALDPKDLSVLAVWMEGEIVFRSGGFELA